LVSELFFLQQQCTTANYLSQLDNKTKTKGQQPHHPSFFGDTPLNPLLKDSCCSFVVCFAFPGIFTLELFSFPCFSLNIAVAAVSCLFFLGEEAELTNTFLSSFSFSYPSPPCLLQIHTLSLPSLYTHLKKDD